MSNSRVDLNSLPVDIQKLFFEAEIIAHDFPYKPNRFAVPEEKDQVELAGKKYSFITSQFQHTGLVYYILHSREKDDNDIKVVFRGTSDLASMIRDLESGGAGHGSFQEAAKALIQQIHNAIKQAVEKNNLHKVSISLYGHSLGGADAQNCLAVLMKKIVECTADKDEKLESNNYYNKIEKIRLFAFNAAGIAQVTATTAAKNAEKLKEKNIKLDCHWLLAAGDAVQQTGESSILATVDSNIAKVHLIKVHHAKAPEKIWQNFLMIPEAYKAAQHTFSTHTGHYFNPENSQALNFEYYFNVEKEQQEIIQKKLLNKSSLLQSWLINFLQQLMFYTAKNAVNLFTTTASASLSSSNLSGSTEEPWVLVEPPGEIKDSDPINIEEVIENLPPPVISEENSPLIKSPSTTDESETASETKSDSDQKNESDSEEEDKEESNNDARSQLLGNRTIHIILPPNDNYLTIKISSEDPKPVNIEEKKPSPKPENDLSEEKKSAQKDENRHTKIENDSEDSIDDDDSFLNEIKINNQNNLPSSIQPSAEEKERLQPVSHETIRKIKNELNAYITSRSNFLYNLFVSCFFPLRSEKVKAAITLRNELGRQGKSFNFTEVNDLLNLALNCNEELEEIAHGKGKIKQNNKFGECLEKCKMTLEASTKQEKISFNRRANSN